MVGSTDHLRKNPGVYEVFLRRECDARVVSVIRRDLDRTYPKHPLFMRGNESHALDKLDNVLRAYANFAPEIGYCQGLNFLVALLLMQMPEEDAFWMLVVLMKEPRFNLQRLFGPGLPMLQDMFRRHELELFETLPDLYTHFLHQGIRTSMYSSAWFHTLFTSSFPLRTSLRVFDVLLLEGLDIIFVVTMRIMRACKATLLRTYDLDIVTFLRDVPQTYLDPDTLLAEEPARWWGPWS